MIRWPASASVGDVKVVRKIKLYRLASLALVLGGLAFAGWDGHTTDTAVIGLIGAAVGFIGFVYLSSLLARAKE